MDNRYIERGRATPSIRNHLANLNMSVKRKHDHLPDIIVRKRGPKTDAFLEERTTVGRNCRQAAVPTTRYSLVDKAGLGRFDLGSDTTVTPVKSGCALNLSLIPINRTCIASTNTVANQQKNACNELTANVPAAPCTPTTERSNNDAQSFENAEKMNVLQSWGITKSEEQLKRIVLEGNHATKECLLQTLLPFLSGTPISMNANQIFEFIEEFPECIVGKFCVGLMLVYLVARLEFSDLQQIHSKCSKVAADVNLKQIITNTALYMIQKAVWQELPNTNKYKDLEGGLDLMVSLDVSNRDVDRECLDVITTALKDLMFEDMNSSGDGKARLLDNTFDFNERVKLWTMLLLESIGMLIQEPVVNLFMSRILLSELTSNNDGTETEKIQKYCRVTDKDTPLLLHTWIVKRQVSSVEYAAISRDTSINASLEDATVFKTLLYQQQNYNHQQLKGRITMGVYRLVAHIRVSEPWKFLFGNTTTVKIFSDHDRHLLLKIAIKSGNEEIVDRIAGQFCYLFSCQERLTCLNGLSANQVCNLLDRRNLLLDEIEVYQLLIHWSFHAATGVPLPNKQKKFEYNESADRQFVNVCKVLRLAELEPFFKDLIEENFVTAKDIVDTRRVAFLTKHAPSLLRYTETRITRNIVIVSLLPVLHCTKRCQT